MEGVSGKITEYFNLFDIVWGIREASAHIPPLPTGFGHTGNPFGDARIFFSYVRNVCLYRRV